ncbi:hypothetical protein ACG2K1_04955 [Neisseria sp. 23W00296]|uniref:hypothetical protein n=1 Tax=unclassified Neisseria TaxID=2623750 RepID=UPI0002A41610|nr:MULTISPECIES: hypothetical protein [unclassified Neisseria]ASP17859.1 hypothetical protein CGZ77_08965 [Neisseria sp. KEM232]EKY04471.1 hypothetical protein HMPREF9120_02267 [Neisseria sp. oral taxon 020 str. F0370]
MSASLIRPQNVETADCLLENMQIGGKHITLHFAEIYRTDLQAFVPKVVIEISDWQQFHGRAYHAKTECSRTIAESRIEPLEAVAAYRFSNGLLTLQGFALPPSEEWLEYVFVQPVIRITQRPSERRKP